MMQKSDATLPEVRRRIQELVIKNADDMSLEQLREHVKSLQVCQGQLHLCATIPDELQSKVGLSLTEGDAYKSAVSASSDQVRLDELVASLQEKLSLLDASTSKPLVHDSSKLSTKSCLCNCNN